MHIFQQYLDYINNILNSDALSTIAQNGGPLVGIMLPIIEAFFPILPLVLFVTINVTVFGLFWGYIFSWIGNCIGSFLLFLLIRKIGGKKIEKKISASKYNGALEKIKTRNYSLLFFLYCFPFTPSFLISSASALANMSVSLFLLILLPSKLVMLISLAFIGFNIKSFFVSPAKSVIYVILVLVVNLAFKTIVEKSHLFITRKKEK